MPKALRFCVWLILHTIVAIFGTAVLDTAFGKAFHPHSLAAILWKEWILSLVCATFIGFFMWRTWRVSAAMWVWILPCLWFALRFLPALLGSQSHSALIGRGLSEQFSGAACEGGTRALGCINFFVFTIPFVRGVSYSAGAFLASQVIKPESQPANSPRPEQSQSAS